MQGQAQTAIRVFITDHFCRRYNRRVAKAGRRLQRILLEGLLAAGKAQQIDRAGQFHAIPLGNGQRAILSLQRGAWVAVTVLRCRTGRNAR